MRKTILIIFIETKYDDRKNILKTEMQDTIDKEAEDNFEAFKDKLKINKMHDDVRVLYEIMQNLLTKWILFYFRKKGKLDNAIHVLEDKLRSMEEKSENGRTK